MQSLSNNPVHTVPSKQHRFHLLDAIRGIAALLVVAYHAPPEFGRLVPFRSGFLAVDLFFALSGFVIAFSYERRLHEGLSYRDFTVARLIRLYPVYVFGTVFAVVIGLTAGHAWSSHGFVLELALGLLLLPNVFHGTRAAVYPLDFPAWSLLSELVSYLGYATLVLWRSAGKAMLYVAICACAVFMMVWTHGSGTVDSGSVLRTLPMGLARAGYSFGAGVLIYRYFHLQRRERLSGLRSLLLVGGICVVVVATLATSVTRSPASQLLTVFLVFPVLIYFGALTTMTGWMGRVAAFLGDTSYPIYLLHIPFFTLFQGRGMRQVALHHQHAGPVLAALSIAFLLAFSWAASRWFDLPVRRRLSATYNQRLRHAG